MEFDRIADKKRVDFITGSIQTAALPAGAPILDIGCGNGIISQALGRLGYQVTGIDVSEKTISAADAANRLPNVQFRVVEAGALQPEPGRYAAIICSEVLEHLEQPADLLHVIHSSLAPEGVLVVTVPNGYGPRELLVTRPVQALQRNDSAAWKLLSRIKKSMGYTGVTAQSSADDLRHIQFFTRQSLHRLAQLTGFRIEKILPSNFVEQVFPYSLLARRSRRLQQLDCWLADRLPLAMTSGFMSIWKKNPQNRAI